MYIHVAVTDEKRHAYFPPEADLDRWCWGGRCQRENSHNTLQLLKIAKN